MMFIIKKISLVLAMILLFIPVNSHGQSGWMRETGVPTFMTFSGMSLVGIWTIDLINGEKIDKSDGLLKMKDKTTGQILMPHLIAEYSTGACLLAGAYGLYAEKPWGKDVAMLGLGALMYTSMNSLSWVLTEKERYVYGIPMVFTLTGSGISLVFLL